MNRYPLYHEPTSPEETALVQSMRTQDLRALAKKLRKDYKGAWSGGTTIRNTHVSLTSILAELRKRKSIQRIASAAIGQTIANQIGNRAFVMMGARSLVTLEDGLQFKIGRNPKKITTIVVRLDPNDTYTVEFWRGMRLAKDIDFVYADDLEHVIEDNTGLYLRL